MTETERAALDALVAWRKAKLAVIAAIRYTEIKRAEKELETAKDEADSAADRLIVEREGR